MSRRRTPSRGCSCWPRAQCSRAAGAPRTPLWPRRRRRLLEAVDQGDGEAACALLAPAVRTEIEDTTGKPCERAILDEPLGDASGPAQVEVFDTAAQAVVGSETLFLSRFDGRWLVIAAACTAVPDQPYDCSIGMP